MLENATLYLKSEKDNKLKKKKKSVILVILGTFW